MKMVITVDNKIYQLEELDDTYISSSFHLPIKIIKNREDKYTIKYDICGVYDKSFTTLIAAFREALLVQRKFV